MMDQIEDMYQTIDKRKKPMMDQLQDMLQTISTYLGEHNTCAENNRLSDHPHPVLMQRTFAEKKTIYDLLLLYPDLKSKFVIDIQFE